MTISNVGTSAAFFAVANDQNSMSNHGKWIPADYWAYLCSKRLQTASVKTAKLRRALEPHMEQEELLSASIVHGLGCVVKVEATTRHLRLGGDGRKRTKACLFIKVETTATLATTDLFPTDNVEAQAAFMDLYHTYMDMIEPIPSAPPLTIHTALPRAENENQIQTNSNQSETQPVRPVTPEPQTALDLDANIDIRRLLTGVINPAILKQNDLFVDDGSFDVLRERIRKYGMKLQLEKNKEKYSMLAPDDTLADEIDSKKYKPFLNNFCCPINSRAIQGIIAIALQIAQDNGGNGTIQLPRVNGGTEQKQRQEQRNRKESGCDCSFQQSKETLSERKDVSSAILWCTYLWRSS